MEKIKNKKDLAYEFRRRQEIVMDKKAIMENKFQALQQSLRPYEMFKTLLTKVDEQSANAGRKRIWEWLKLSSAISSFTSSIFKRTR